MVTYIPPRSWWFKGNDCVSRPSEPLRSLVDGALDGCAWFKPVVRQEHTHLYKSRRKDKDKELCAESPAGSSSSSFHQNVKVRHQGFIR